MDIKWPTAVVALGIFGVLGGIVIAAIIRYETPDEAMTVFGGVWGALGAGIGLVFAYFFTRGPINEAQKMAEKANAMAETANEMAEEAISMMNKPRARARDRQ
jgi:hypothetical protein